MNLAANWRKIRLRETGRPRYFSLTAGLYSLYKAVKREGLSYISGRVLDAGAGLGAWTPLLITAAAEVISVDLAAAGRPDAVADLKHLPFPDGSFDAAFCSQVLEHERRPGQILAELGRVLVPGGALVLTAPHLSRLHDAPDDYFRFTRYGLRALCEDAGLRVEKVVACGGLLSFVGHNAAVLGLSLAAPLGPLRAAATATAKLLSPLAPALDRLFDRGGLFASNWLLVARKYER